MISMSAFFRLYPRMEAMRWANGRRESARARARARAKRACTALLLSILMSIPPAPATHLRRYNGFESFTPESARDESAAATLSFSVRLPREKRQPQGVSAPAAAAADADTAQGAGTGCVSAVGEGGTNDEASNGTAIMVERLGAAASLLLVWG